MSLLVTGCAGFIGFHVTLSYLQQGQAVVGVDNLNEYYDVQLKRDRLALLKKYPHFQFHEFDLSNNEELEKLFETQALTHVVHLAAQAGVRYSLHHPHAYVSANIQAFLNILEACRHHRIQHLVYASSSSVYGANTHQPFSETESVDHPLALYAATKKANELMAHSYSHLYQIPTTGLRFFTVYGPWGRPDMALFLFTKNILANQPIQVFNHGNMVRDFTYIDDIVAGIKLAVTHTATGDATWNGDTPNPATSRAPYRIYNIGNNRPIELMSYIHAIESALGKQALLDLQPLQDGDVPSTNADISLIQHDLGYNPQVNVQTGIERFVDWYLSYYRQGVVEC